MTALLYPETIYLGTYVHKVESKSEGTCACGEPACGYVLLETATLSSGDPRPRTHRSVEVPLCRTHFLVVKGGLMDGREAQEIKSDG